jgi:flagellar motor component MotA
MHLENSMESILNIFREGSLAIQSGENPSVVRELLYSFIPDNLEKQ